MSSRRRRDGARRPLSHAISVGVWNLSSAVTTQAISEREVAVASDVLSRWTVLAPRAIHVCAFIVSPRFCAYLRAVIALFTGSLCTSRKFTIWTKPAASQSTDIDQATFRARGLCGISHREP